MNKGVKMNLFKDHTWDDNDTLSFRPKKIYKRNRRGYEPLSKEERRALKQLVDRVIRNEKIMKDIADEDV